MKIKRKNRIYAIDVHWDFAKCFKVEASSRDDAIEKVERTMDKIIGSAPASMVNPLDYGFEAMEDYEVSYAGAGDTEDTIAYV